MFCCTHSHFIVASSWDGRDARRYTISSSSHVCQRSAQLLGCPEQRVLGGFFSRVQHFADGPQLQSLVMLQLENHSLARGELIHCVRNTAAQLQPPQIPLGMCSAASVG